MPGRTPSGEASRVKHLRGVLASLALAAAPAAAQVQEVGFDDPILVESTAPVAVESIEVTGTSPFDVALTAHVYAEGTGFAHERYEIAIRRGSAAGALVGRAIWRPGDKTVARGYYEGEPIALTGFDAGAAGPTTYVLTASKIEADAPAIRLYPRGLDASAAPAGTSLRGFQVTDDSGVALASTTPTSLGSLVVEAGAGSDVVLAAHVQLEGSGLGEGVRWTIGICRGSASGPQVGRAVHRPPSSADPSAYQADTVALTGFDAGVQGSTTYVLCGAKIDANAPSVSARLRGMHAVAAPAGTALSGTQQLTILPGVELDDSSQALAAVTVSGDGVYGVRLAGHVYLEGEAFGGSRYAVGICRGDASGPLVGHAYWRPETRSVDGFFVGDTLALTGWDPHRSGATSYVLCASSRDSGAPLVTAFERGLVAQVPEPSAALALAAAALALAALPAARSAGRGPLTRPLGP